MLKCSPARHNYQTKYKTNGDHNSPRPRVFNQAEPWKWRHPRRIKRNHLVPFPDQKANDRVFPVTNLVRGGRAGIRTRPCALPPALPFLLSLLVLRPSRPPPFFPPFNPSLFASASVSPSSLLRRVESPPDVPSSGSQSSALLQLFSPCAPTAFTYCICAVIGVSWTERRRRRRRRPPPRCHVPANSLTTLTIRIPRGRRGLVDNWRRARANCRFFDILYGRERATRLSRHETVSWRWPQLDGWRAAAAAAHREMTRRWNKSAGEIFFHGCRKCGRGHTSVLIPARPTRPYEIFHGYMERQRYIFCRINALPELGRWNIACNLYSL